MGEVLSSRPADERGEAEAQPSASDGGSKFKDSGAEPVGEVPTGLCWRSSTAVACLIARASACIKSRLRARVRGHGASVAARALRQDQLPQVGALFELEASSLAGVKPLHWGAVQPFWCTLHLLALSPAFCWQGVVTAALWWRRTCGIVPDERGEGLTETTDLQGLHVRRQLLDSLPPGGERGVRDWSSGENRRCSGWRDRGEVFRCVCQRRSLGVCGVFTVRKGAGEIPAGNCET